MGFDSGLGLWVHEIGSYSCFSQDGSTKLHSVTPEDLIIPNYHMMTRRAFLCIEPSIRNNLPMEIENLKCPRNIHSLCKNLNTHILRPDRSVATPLQSSWNVLCKCVETCTQSACFSCTLNHSVSVGYFERFFCKWLAQPGWQSKGEDWPTSDTGSKKRSVR